jgi:hypothetical protein
MTLDELQARDSRIATLEAIPKDRRNGVEQDELGRLSVAREAHWRRLPEAVAIARRKARDLETYARQWRLPLSQEQEA